MAYVLVGAFTPWSAGLAQWANSGEWPPRIIWIGVILPMSIVGGGSALLAFLTNSFGQYEQQKKADETGQTQTVETKPSVKT